MTDMLDRGMFERLRDIQVATSLDTMRDTYPDYAAIGFISPERRVLAATSLV